MNVPLGRSTLTLCALGLALGAGPAFAAEAVKATAEVVLASNKGNKVDPALARLQKELQKDRKRYTSLTLVSKKELSLTKGKPADVSMPGNRSSRIQLLGLKDGVAQVSVNIKQNGKELATATYTLARGKSTVIGVGAHEGGALVLVLSPPD